MSLKFLHIILLSIISVSIFSQAIMDIESPNEGVLLPRIQGTDLISNPVEGLIIYDLNQHCLKYFNGSWWSDCIGTFSSSACSGIITDARDDQDYAIVRIGNQCWMAENLNIGSQLGSLSNPTNNGIIEKHCYENDPLNCDTLGGLYQWDELMTYTTVPSATGICPAGWHIPSDLEIQTLEIALGMSPADATMVGFRGTNQGSQMSGVESLWSDDALDMDAGFGVSQLNLIPAGARNADGMFLFKNHVSYLWTSTEESQSSTTALRRYLYSFSTQSQRAGDQKDIAFSVRCVRN